MAEVYLDSVEKKFGQKIAVKGISLKIEDGEFMVFLGPSGCGKTTTLNCIAGLEVPSAGRIYFDGEDVTDLPPHKRNVAMVFQSALLYPHLSAYKNIKMSLKIYKMSPSEMDSRIKEAASLLGIEDLLNKKPFEMSGGERQRVAVAKALVRRPRVFLMDEPLSSLDAALREGLRAELVAIQKKVKATMIYVTHDQIEAMTMGDRITVMNKGEIQQVGTPIEVYKNPVNLFVAGFVGSPPMNFFEGVVEEGEHGIEFVYGAYRLWLPGELAKFAENVRKDKRLVMGVRPQNTLVFRTPPDGSCLKGRIYGLERLGKENVVIVELEDEQRVKAVVDPDFSGEIGDYVYVAVQQDAIYLFDAASGKNLAV